MTLSARWMLALSALAAISAAGTAARADVRTVLSIRPGTAAESALVVGAGGSAVRDGAREAASGASWTYRLPVLPGALCTLAYESTGSARLRVDMPNGKPLHAESGVTPNGGSLRFRVPPTHALGEPVRIVIVARDGTFRLMRASLAAVHADKNSNGIADAIDLYMSGAVAQRPNAMPVPRTPMTSFQTGEPYDPACAPPTDAVLVQTSDRDVIGGWAEAGYQVQTMGGFRESEDYVRQRPGEAQTDRDGKMLVVGGSSYYMVPTVARNEKSRAYFEAAVASGATAVCPEEPEFFARAGYSEAFRAEWQAFYGVPWEAPHTSIDARYRSERLKAELTRRQVESILAPLSDSAPHVRRMLALHSPINYADWGIVAPHAALARSPAVQELIAQVWTGTARTPIRVAGVRRERTFSLGYLEYASFANLVRGIAKPLWFLMDPVEDNPDRTLDDYRRNYADTLVASLMFPSVDRFEVMPWPRRVYERASKEYATVVNTVVGALADIWRHPTREVKAGSNGIGLLIGDTMALQRGDPSPSDFGGLYALSAPLVGHGIQVQPLMVERASDPGYLNGVRVLLASYDFLKPDRPEAHASLAAWVERGGVLALVGGGDAYDAVSASWWRKQGDASPLIDLFRRLKLDVRPQSAQAAQSEPPMGTVVLRAEAQARALENRRRYTVDLQPFVGPLGSVCVRFEDVTKEDAWGPFVASAELRIRGQLAASFRSGSEMETRFLERDSGSLVSGDIRRADGPAYWVYRFDGLPQGVAVTLTIDVGNGFLISAYPAPARREALEEAEPGTDPVLRRIRLTSGYSVLPCNVPQGGRLLYRRSSDGAPVVWSAKVGSGYLLYCGVQPGLLSATAQTDRWLRSLVRRACDLAGAPLQTADAFVAKRGPYMAVRTLARPVSLEGRYVDLLQPDLPILEDPEIPADRAALLLSAGDPGRQPRVLAVAGRMRARLETPTVTSFVAHAPTGPTGSARLWAGARTPAGAKACTLWGETLPITFRAQGRSVLLSYPNRAEGVVVRAAWK